MKGVQGFYQAVQDLVWVGQLGLDLMAPLLLCLWLCWWATTRFGVGLWVYLPGFFLGLAGGCSNAWRFYRRKQKQGPKDPPTAFNRHR